MNEVAILDPNHFESTSYFDVAVDALVHFPADKKILLAMFCPFKNHDSVPISERYFFKEVMLLFSGVSELRVPEDNLGKSINWEGYLLQREEWGLTLDRISARVKGANEFQISLEFDRLSMPVAFCSEQVRIREWTVLEKEKIGQKSYYFTDSEQEPRIDLEQIIEEAYRDYRAVFA